MKKKVFHAGIGRRIENGIYTQAVVGIWRTVCSTTVEPRTAKTVLAMYPDEGLDQQDSDR